MNTIGNYSHIIDVVCKSEKSRVLVSKIIPILVGWARKGEYTHAYEELTHLLGYKRYSGIGKQLEYIDSTLDALSKATGTHIPTLNAIVCSKKSGLPSYGFSFVEKSYDELDLAEKKLIVDAKNKEATKYKEWHKVLEWLGLHPVNDETTESLFPDEVNEKEVITEGTASQVLVNRYERSAEARAKCIALKGYRCSVCGMDFEKMYGEIGKNFIHVHHTTALSSIGKDYQIDYEKELVPVCPNCHAMLHRRNPPYGVKDLANMIKHR